MTHFSAKALYKQLLTAVDRNLTTVAGNKQWREYVVASFKKNAGLKDPVLIQQQIQLAQDYQRLITNIAQHQELLLGFNIGLSEEERNKQMVESVSKRVGFKLPKPHYLEQQ
ncbi:hypothetical protein DUNSADRAFT_6991 [Dunaliella salina]|uniref:Uncharacterized protein n=1 Tax=Dunaliella salina TaxID=3046 RepID=A0ABQ7GM74_DUNSA|nr:hypothetical protein DUNSADRAFT_6991 [Dunaliella salina]|eukprot:KAF5835712.1 hypothetical protein DUNSADRAFT_6991 [Dunaliella salina]